MARVYFPTKNEIGVRTLRGVGGDNFDGWRAPAEPAPRGASNPVSLGAAIATPIHAPGTVWGSNPPTYHITQPPASAPAPIPANASIVNVSDIAPGMLSAGYSSTAINQLATYGVTAAQLQSLKNTYPPGAAFNSAAAALTASLSSGKTAGDNVINPISTFVSSVDTSLMTAPPVSQQTSPTPTVNVPVSPPATAPLVTSGGGTASPNVAPTAPTTTTNTYTTDAQGNIYDVQTGQMILSAAQAAAAGLTAQSLTSANVSAANAAAAAPATSTITATATDLTDQVAGWLGATTAVFGYNVPNALLAGGVILGFALLTSKGGKKR